MAEFPRKRSPAFTANEMAILLDEVQQHRDTLFGRTRGKKHIISKNRIWQAIARCLAPCSPCGLRDWQGVRKKWHDLASLTKKKSALVRSEIQGMGDGAPVGTILTPDEEKVMAIIGNAAVEGVDGAVDVLGGEGMSKPTLTEDEGEASGSSATAVPPTTNPSNSSLAAGDVTPPPPLPRRQPALAGVRMRSGLRWPSALRCSCSEVLVASEREKLVVLREIAQHLKRTSTIQEEILAMKRERLELQRRQLALTEAQFVRPSISVPIILPQDSGDSEDAGSL